MSKYMVDSSDLTSVADAIRSKAETDAPLEFPDEFVSAVNSISGIEKFRSLVDKTITTVTAKDLAGVTKIGAQAFYRCSLLVSVTIPSSVTEIGDFAFQASEQLSLLTFSEGLLKIEKGAFQNCSRISSIIIPNSVTSIGNGAFFYANLVKKDVVIGSGIQLIAASAFNYCNLNSFTCKALTPPTLGGNIFQGAVSNLPIYVPAQSVEAYKQAQYWSDRADYIQAIPE